MSDAANSLREPSLGDRDASPADIINRLNREIASLSLSIPDNIEYKIDAERAKTVNDLKARREDILEKQRVSAVVLENTLSKQTFECLVCSKEVKIGSLDDVADHSFIDQPPETYDSSNMRAKLGFTLNFCCKGNLCMDCFAEYVREGCVLCGAKRPDDDEALHQATIRFANTGNAWAQFEAGTRFYDKSKKTENVVECEKQAEEFLQQAAANGNSCAKAMLAHLYGGLIPSESLEMENKDDLLPYLEAAAEHGDRKAQGLLGAYLYHDGNKMETVKWWTLAAHQGSPRAAHGLADLFSKGEGGLEVSLERANHYYQIGAKHGIPEAQFRLSKTIFHLQKDFMHIPGYSCIPRCLYWARKARENGYGPADGLINGMEQAQEAQCAECQRSNPKGGCCGYCHSFWYCSRACQRNHWKDGHKIDCFKGE